MTRKTNVILCLAAALVVWGLASGSVAHADVTGSFGTHIGIHLPDDIQTVTEQEALEFDIQNAINLTVVISGLSTTLHSHFGLAGVEDVTLTYAATLGALSIRGSFVFGRFAGTCIENTPDPDGDETCEEVLNNPRPLTSDLLFIKKRVKTTLTLGGINLQNLAMFEDVNFPETQAAVTHQTDDQTFAFGDVITLQGQTPSGIDIRMGTGICAERSPNVIKKHSFPYEVNPHCGGETVEGQVQTPSQKPNLAFDFERLDISGIPVASGVNSSVSVVCVRTFECELSNEFTFSSMGPIPFSVDIVFTDLFTLDFDKLALMFSTGTGSLELELAPNGTISAISLDIATTLNPDANPANFRITSSIEPGTGLTEADMSLDIQRSNVNFGMTAMFDGGPPATFDAISFELGTTVGVVDINMDATFGTFEFRSWSSSFVINF